MRLMFTAMLAMTLLLSAYAVYTAKKAESAARPQLRPIVAQVR